MSVNSASNQEDSGVDSQPSGSSFSFSPSIVDNIQEFVPSFSPKSSRPARGAQRHSNPKTPRKHLEKVPKEPEQDPLATSPQHFPALSQVTQPGTPSNSVQLWDTHSEKLKNSAHLNTEATEFVMPVSFLSPDVQDFIPGGSAPETNSPDIYPGLPKTEESLVSYDTDKLTSTLKPTTTEFIPTQTTDQEDKTSQESDDTPPPPTKPTYTIIQLLELRHHEKALEPTDAIKELSLRKIIYNKVKMKRGGQQGNRQKPKEEEEPEAFNRKHTEPDTPSTPDTIEWRREKTEMEKKIEESAVTHYSRLQAEKDDLQKLQRLIKVTLNKLSPSNFDKLKVQLLNIAKQDTYSLEFLSKGIFQKACTETKFTDLYAALCQYLSMEYKQFQLQASGEEEVKGVFKDDFRKNVLNVCQELFEDNPKDSDFQDLTQEEAQFKRNAFKRKTLGNVRFIGELYKVNFISPKTVLNCVHDLIHPVMRHHQDFTNLDFDEIEDDKLEGAALLLKTGGSKLEKSSLRERMRSIAEFIEVLINSGRLPNRVKFLLMEVMELRQNNWEATTPY